MGSGGTGLTRADTASQSWVLQSPFDPATQDRVLFSNTGWTGGHSQAQAVEVFQGKIYYYVRYAGGATPDKVCRFDPETWTNEEVLGLAPDSGGFVALKQMRGALYISHSTGRLWKYDGSTMVELTGTPFRDPVSNTINAVSSMAEFNGKTYFGTWGNRIYESADGSSFVLKASFGTPWSWGPFSIDDLVVWKGALYGCTNEQNSFAAKIFRTTDAEHWSVVTQPHIFSFEGFVATPDRLYVGSIESPSGPSFKVRGTTDGQTWSDVFYTTSQGKSIWGHPQYFSQNGTAYFTILFGQPWLVPVKDGIAQPTIPLQHAFASLIEANGRLFAIGPQDRSSWQSSPYVISLLGNYSAPLSDIAILSATTPDSQSVSVTYNIVGTGISQLQLCVYRSADKNFDPDPREDLPVGSLQITDISPGEHQAILPFALPPAPGRPYVLVVADPDNSVAESNEDNNTAYFAKPVIGVVTHGFALSPLPGSAGWVDDMKASLLAAGYADALAVHWEPSAGLFAPEPGMTQLAGAGMAATIEADLVALRLIDPAMFSGPVDLHLIGHSRGAVVISEAAVDLDRGLLNGGYIKLTMLDPHPARNGDNEWFSYMPKTAMCNLGWLAKNALIAFQFLAEDPEPSTAGPDDVEAYYQNNEWYETPLGTETFLNLWGENSLPGVSYEPPLPPGYGHSEVVDYYQTQVINPQIPSGSASALSDALPAALRPAEGRSAPPALAASDTTRVGTLSNEPSETQAISDVDLLYPQYVDERGVAERIASELAAASAAYDDGTLRIASSTLNDFVATIQAERGIHIVPEFADYLSAMGQLVANDFQTTFETKSPVMAPIEDKTVSEGSTLAFAAAATDPNAGETLTFRLDAAPPGAVIDPLTGVFTWIPADGLATAEVTVRVTDSGTPPLSDITSLTITVNNVPPVITSLSTSAMTPGGAGEGQTVTLGGTFTDPGLLDTHTAIVDWGDGTTGAAVIQEAGGSGSLSGSHAYGGGGLYSITVSLADNDRGTTSGATTAVIRGAGVHDGVLQIVGTQGDDRVGVNMCSQNSIKVHASFLPKPGFEVFDAAGIQRIVILLGDGDDLAMVSGDVTLTSVIDGGRGNDFLNGGGGSNILLGGDGLDMLLGGPRRDILIGGRGSDMLVGGGGDDILIGARTTMDPHPAALPAGFDEALLAVLAEWNAETLYEDRVTKIRPRIVALEDNAADVLVGCAGQDWFFARLRTDARDRILDRHADEFVEPVG